MMEQSSALGFWDKGSEDLLRDRFPVHRACRDGDTGALSVLLAHGKYDLYTEDQFYGWTPAHWSAYHGKLDCLQLLVTAGVNFDVATQRFHQTPGHVAAFGNQPHCLMWLIQSGASVNAQDYLGETPAHKAARSGGLECLGILKANGAIFRVVNNNGHTPKDLAYSCCNEPCALYIQQVEGAPHAPNGFASGHLCRKRGTDDVVNGDLKKARTEEAIHHNGTENMEVTNGTASESHKESHGQQLSPVAPPVNGQLGLQGNGDGGQATGQVDSLTSNGLSLPSVGDPDPRPNCRNGNIQDTPTPCMHLPRPPPPQPPTTDITTPTRMLQASDLISLYTESDLESPMQTHESHPANGIADRPDAHNMPIHFNGVANGNVPVSASASTMEHEATVAMALGYNKLCESAYTSVGYCHFF